jgi:hypothetical protein
VKEIRGPREVDKYGRNAGENCLISAMDSIHVTGRFVNGWWHGVFKLQRLAAMTADSTVKWTSEQT